jgi:hypothetical protein
MHARYMARQRSSLGAGKGQGMYALVRDRWVPYLQVVKRAAFVLSG